MSFELLQIAKEDRPKESKEVGSILHFQVSVLAKQLLSSLRIFRL